MRLADPLFLIALVVAVPLLVWWWRSGRTSPPTLRYSDLRITVNARPTNRVNLVWLPHVLRAIVIVLVIVAVARPQFGAEREEVTSKGIDIIMVLDNSGSMRVIDVAPGTRKVDPNRNRLAVAKDVIRDFIKRRRNDRIGLIKFAGKAYYQCPQTLDYGILLTFLDSIEINEKDPNTAIGDALGTAVLHLKDSDAESKVVVLVTDGENNSGLLSPATATEAAKKFNVKVYTVGVGSNTNAYIPRRDIFGMSFQPIRSGLDEETLKKIAETTGARYFRATDPEDMLEVFRRIDAMEKTEIKTNRYTEYSERFTPWALSAMLLLGIEILLATGPLRQSP